MCLISMLCSATLVSSLNSKLPEQAAVNSQLETHDLKSIESNSQQTIQIQKQEMDKGNESKPPMPEITETKTTMQTIKKDDINLTFYGKIGDMKQRIQVTIDHFFGRCDLTKNIHLAKIVALAKIMASYIAASKHMKIPDDLFKFDAGKYDQLRCYSSLVELQNALRIKAPIKDICNNIWKRIWDEIDEEIEKRGLPIFIRRMIEILFDNFLAIESLRYEFPNLKDDDNVPTTWTGSQYMKVSIDKDGEIDITSTTTTCKTDKETIEVSTPHFTKGGIVFVIWGKDSLFELKGRKTNVFRGYINNKAIVEYTLLPNEEKGIVDHQLKFGEKTILVPTKSTCKSIFNVIISIQKDCDKYKVYFTARFLASNKKYSTQWDEYADRIEGLQLSYNNDVVLKQKYYPNFRYTPDSDSILIAADIELFKEEIQKSLPCNPDCKYSENGHCKICKKPKVVQNGKCVLNCDHGFYKYKNRECLPCHKRCDGCHCGSDKGCIKCRRPFVRLGKRCVESCPEDMAQNENNECVPCGEHCQKCQDLHHCIRCKAGTFLKNGKCVHDCEDGFFADVNPNECKPCHEHCVKCTNRGKCSCLVPAPGWALFNCIPVPKCPEGYYKDPVDLRCKECTKHCKVCNDPYSCQKCIKGFNLLPNKTCTPKCPVKSISVDGICVQCTTPDCDICSASNTNSCITCSPGFYLWENKCVKTCPEKTYEDKERGECIKCHQKHCRKCNEERCIDCDWRYKLFQNEKCVEECPDGYVAQGKKCVKCQEESKCKKCLPESLETCTECYGSKILFNGHCIDKCPKKYFERNKKCIPCLKWCDKCENETECIECDKEHLLKRDHCVEHCGEGFTKVFKKCEKCEVDDCESCDSRVEKCDKCKKGYFLFNNKCYKKCPPKTFANQANRLCERCPHDCEVCENKHSCKVCVKGKVLDGTECKDHCKDGEIAMNGVCVPCKNRHCRKCSHHNTNICTECPEDTYFYRGDCVRECPLKTYRFEKECKDCVRPCETCESREECTTCIDHFYLLGKKCTDNCPEKTVMKDKKCVNCHDKRCEKCSDVGVRDCIKCEKGTYLYEGKCVEKCPIKMYHDDGVCKPCLKHCRKCHHIHHCEECEHNFFLKNRRQECVDDCGDGYVEKDKECQECKKTCKKCRRDDTEYCTKCIWPLLLFQGDCLAKCPSGTYVDELLSECKKCDDIHCHRCSRGGKHCEICKSGFVMEEEKCIQQPCHEGYVLAQNHRECHKCQVEHCKKCPNTNLNKCHKCKDDYFLNLLNGKCVKTCPAGTYMDHFDKECKPCPHHCKTCSDATTCLSCEIRYSLWNKKCVPKCPPKTLSIRHICVECREPECEECNPINDCLKCVFPFLLTPEGKCVKKCAIRHFKSRDKCRKCEQFCEVCKDENTCIKCQKGKFLSATNHCIDSCPSGSIEVDGRCVKCKTDEDCNKCCEKDLSKCVECKDRMVIKNNKCYNDCGDGYFTERRRCKPCSEHCDSCDNRRDCHRCERGYYLFRKRCVKDCPTGYRGVDGRCIECSENCDECNSHECIYCHHGFYLENGRCVKECSEGYYMEHGRCKKCDEGCAKCKGPRHCIVCIPPKKLKNGLCVKKCGLGFTVMGPNCVKCSVDYCENCDDDVQECKKCKKGHPLYKKKCVKTCPSGTFEMNNECIDCIKHCDICHNTETCEKCHPHYLVSSNGKKCIEKCPSGYRPMKGKCVKCEVNHCHICDHTLSKCKKCVEPYYLVDGECRKECPIGMYIGFNRENHERECKYCLKECKRCDSLERCTECNEGFDLKGGKCIPKCHPGEFRDDEGKCVRCDDRDCELCYKDIHECLRCKIPKILFNKKCVDHCEDGYFVNESKECEKCEKNCHKCDHRYGCIKCDKFFVLQNNHCKPHCDDGYTKKYDECYPCKDSECKKCHSDQETCIHCHKGYILRHGKCVKECKNGEYVFVISDDDKECRNCDDSKCIKCDRKDNCKLCKEGFHPYRGKCIKCEDGYVVDFKEQCQKCIPEHCEKCDRLTNKTCKKCKRGFYLKNDHCVPKCGEGYHKNELTKKCDKCKDEECLECDENDRCLECKKNMVILPNGRCSEKCQDGYSPNFRKICVQCKKRFCLECDGNHPSQCLRCERGYRMNEEGECVKECKENEYELDHDKCRKCSEICERCKDFYTCTKCKHPKVLSHHTCKDKCRDDEVVVKGVCVKCNVDKCKKCRDETPEECVICKPGFYLHNKKCVEKCEDGYFPEAGKCEKCNKRCKTCRNRYRCETCKAPLVLQDGKCQERCDESYHEVKGICEKCEDFEKVKDCSGPIPICKKHYYLSRQNKCVERCPNGEMPDPTDKCVQCDGDNCEECETIDKCYRCKENKVLLDGKCVPKCPGGYISIHRRCVECRNPHCYKCQTENLKKCTECDDKWFFYKDDCVTRCKEGTFPRNGKCIDCDYKCQICDNKETCKKCKRGFVLKNKKCVSQCGSGFYVDGNNECQPCGDREKCEVCDRKESEDCLQCKHGYLLRKRCLIKCPPTYREDYTLRKCIHCEKYCDKCDENGCIVCSKNSFFKENRPNECAPCPYDDHHQVMDGKCVECKVKNCGKCADGNDKTCAHCKKGFFMVEGKCIEKCEDGTFPVEGTCEPCPDGCATCNSSSTCITCVPPKRLVLGTGQCKETCPSGFGPKPKFCVKCQVENCEDCSGLKPDICTKCIAPALLTPEGDCVHRCKKGTYPKDDKCVKCEDHCPDCISKDKCLTCKIPLKLKNKQCVEHCGKDYHETEDRCIPCTDSNCEKCDKKEDHCDKCKHLTYLQGSKCVPQCKEGFWTNEKERKCVPCKEGCKVCGTIPEKPEQCVVCELGLSLMNGICVKTCPDGTSPQDGKCVPCTDPKCHICSEASPSSCIHCKKPFRVLNKKCVDDCPPGTYYDSEKDRCKDCDFKCQECDKNGDCIKCKTEFALYNKQCHIKCSEGQVKIHGKCVNCADTNCAACLTDVNICVDCKSPYVLFDNQCRINCPSGYRRTKQNRCKKCDIGCEVCPDEDKCTKCLNGYFLNRNGACVKRCEKGQFGDCNANICKDCNEACEECVDETPSNCPKCNPGFFKNDNACVSGSHCRSGTYGNAEKRKCSKCQIQFCAECSSAKKCTKCVRGFELNATGTCSEGKSHVSVFGGYPVLFTPTVNHALIKSFSSHFNGVAIGSNTVTFSFWIRVLNGRNSNTHIFETKSSSGISLLVQITNKKCVAIVNNGKSDVQVNLGDCSYEALYNWKLFIITLNKVDEKGTISVIVKDTKETNYDGSFVIGKTQELVDRESKCKFNGANQPDHFELAYFAIYDYKLDSSENKKIFDNKPIECDFGCQECTDKCHLCKGKWSTPVDGKCSASFVSLVPGLKKYSSQETISLNKHLGRRIDSKHFEFVTWLNLKEENKENDIVAICSDSSDKEVEYIKVSCKDKKMTLNFQNVNYQILPEYSVEKDKWHRFTLSYNDGKVSVSMKDRHGLSKSANVNINSSQLMRIHEDLKIKFNIHGTLSDARFNVNNLPDEKDSNDHFNGLKCPKYCAKCSAELTCALCEKGKRLTLEKECKDAEEYTPIHVLNKVSIFRNEESCHNISTLLAEQSTIRFCIRNRLQSVINARSHTILSYADAQGRKTNAIVEEVIGNHKNKWKIHGTNEFVVDHSSGKIDWTCVNVLVDSSSKSLKYNIEKSSFTVPSDISIKSICFGDNSGQDINIEVASVDVYKSHLNDQFISTLQKPKDCDSACLDCNYKTGECDKCITGDVKKGKCETYLLGYKSAYLYGVQSFNAYDVPAFTTSLRKYFNRDVNSREYSIIGHYKILTTKYTQYKNGVFTIFRLLNSQNSDAQTVISLEFVNAETPFYQWRYQDGGNEKSVKVNDLEVAANQWVSVFCTVDVAQKKIFTTLKPTNAYSEFNNEIPLSFPDLLTETGTFNLFGVQLQKKEGHYYCDVYVNYLYLTTNTPRDPTVLTKFSNHFPITSDPVIENAKLSIRDIEMERDIALACNPGFELKNNKCESHKSERYYIIFDQKSTISGGKAHYSLPSMRDDKNTFIFSFRQNFMPKNELSVIQIIEAGNLKVSLTPSKRGASTLSVSVANSPTSIVFNNLDFDTNRDYTWYRAVLHMEKRAVTLIVFDKSNQVFTKKVLLTVDLSLGESISFNDDDGRVTFYGPHLIFGDFFTSSIVDEKAIIESDNCISRTPDKKCKKCLYGENGDSCVSQPVKIPNISSNSRKSYTLTEFLGEQVFVRNKDYGLVLILDDLSSVSNIVSLSNYPVNTNAAVLSVSVSHKKFFITYDNRYSESVSNSPKGYETAEFDTANEQVLISLSVNSSKGLLTLFLATSNDSKTFEFRVNGAFENIAKSSTLTFGSFSLASHIHFFYDSEVSNDLIKQLTKKYLAPYQKVCLKSNKVGCTLCPSTYPKGLGYCLPVDSYVYGLNEIIGCSNEKSQNSEAKFRGKDGDNELTVGFWYRPVSDSVSDYEILNLDSSKYSFIKVYKTGSSLVVELRDTSGTTVNTVRVPGLEHEFKQLDWIYIAVSIDLKANKMHLYVYFQESGLERYVSNTGSNSKWQLSSKDEFSVKFGGSKNPHRFDVSGFNAIRKCFKENNQFEEYRVRIPDAINQKCLENSTGSCSHYPKPVIEDIGEASKINGKFDDDTLKSIPLYTKLSKYIGETQSNLSWDKYLLSFTVQLKHCYSNEYKANSRVAISLVNIVSDSSLKYNDVIPDKELKYAALALEVRENSIRLYAGGNKMSNDAGYTEFFLGKDSFKSINTVVVQILVKNKNEIFIVLLIDDLTVNFKYHSNNPIEPISKDTYVFVNPFTSNVRINIADPRFSRDYNQYIQGSSDYQHTSSSGLCGKKGNNCEKCQLGADSNDLICTRCSKGYSLFNGACMKTSHHN